MTAGVLLVFLRCFDLCTQTCPFRLAGSALPSVFGGSEQLRKKAIKFYNLYIDLTISDAGFFAKSHMMFFSPVIIPILPAAQE